MSNRDRDALRAELVEFGMAEEQLAVLDRLSPRVMSVLVWLMDRWPGRVALRVATGLRRIQVFDRAMTIAAQLFTSVFPIIIMGAAIFGADQVSSAVSSIGSLPQDTQDLLDEVTTGGDTATFGVLGILVVLVSATSLSRAMIRAYDAVWMNGRTRTRLTQAPKDVAYGLNWVLDHADTPEKEDMACAALTFKTDVLWAQLDALWHAYVAGDIPPGAWRPGEGMAKA